MNIKLVKLGFYVLSYLLLFVGIAILIDYRLSAGSDFNFFELTDTYLALFILVIVSYIFGLITLFLIIKDWIKRKRLPFYIGMIALSVFIIMGLTIGFII